MTSVPVEAVHAQDDADLVQWLLASEMAQDVVFQSLIRGDHHAHGGTSDTAAAAAALPLPNAQQPRTTAPAGPTDQQSPRATRFVSAVGCNLQPADPTPLRMRIPVELLEAEASERHMLRAAYDGSIAMFRHLHPAYLHPAYDWSLGGKRLVLARDPKMFPRYNAERHLPAYLQQQHLAGNKRRDFFSRELGHIMEVKGGLHRAHQQQQQQQAAAALADRQSYLDVQAQKPCGEEPERPEEAAPLFAPRPLQPSAAKVISTQAFIAVPVGIAHASARASTEATASAAVDTKADGSHADAAAATTTAANVVLTKAFAEVATLREQLTRTTIQQSQEFQWIQLVNQEQRDALVVAARVHSRQQAGGFDARHASGPMRLEFDWQANLTLGRNVAPPKTTNEAQRHLPVQFRRPASAGTSNQTKHPLTSVTPLPPQQPLVLLAPTSSTAAAPASTPQEYAIPAGLGCKGFKRVMSASVRPTPPMPTTAQHSYAAPAAAAMDPQMPQESIPVVSVLPRAVAAYRVSSAPVHRTMPKPATVQ